jgi:hypothetical protein
MAELVIPRPAEPVGLPGSQILPRSPKLPAAALVALAPEAGALDAPLIWGPDEERLQPTLTSASPVAAATATTWLRTLGQRRFINSPVMHANDLDQDDLVSARHSRAHDSAEQ